MPNSRLQEETFTPHCQFVWLNVTPIFQSSLISTSNLQNFMTPIILAGYLIKPSLDNTLFINPKSEFT